MSVIIQSKHEGDKVTPKEDEENYGSIKSPQYVPIANQGWFEWGTRHTFALLSFLAYANMYAMRTSLSVAIVAMVNTPAESNNTHIGQECPMQNDTKTKLVNESGNFNGF